MTGNPCYRFLEAIGASCNRFMPRGSHETFDYSFILLENLVAMLATTTRGTAQHTTYDCARNLINCGTFNSLYILLYNTV